MEAAFDGVAAAYDGQFTDTAVGRMQRDLVREVLGELLGRWEQPDVLELNCGTGADARWMAERGARVLATDLSAGMVEVARGSGVEGVEFEAVDLREVVRRRDRQFDVVFSNFGGLNCIGPADLRAFGRDLKGVLRPGGVFVAVVMPRVCLWESVYFMAKGKLRAAVRRWNGGPVMAPLGNGILQPTWYFSPREFAGALGTDWGTDITRPIGFFLPPSYLDPFFHRRSGLLSTLAALEHSSQDLSHRAAWSDHFLMSFRLLDNSH